jgi:hypothetical protein
MSLFHSAEVSCESCGHIQAIQWAGSVNADRRPDLRAAILDGTFQAVDCESCGASLRVPPKLSYMDMGRREWVLVEDYDGLAQWQEREANAQKVFDDLFGPGAPKAAQGLVEGVKVRLVFGWPALREKLRLTELGLDDELVELTKLAVIRGAQEVPLSGRQTLRVVDADGEEIELDVIDDETEATVATTRLPRGLYTDVEGNLSAWQPLRDQWSGAPFIDTARLFIEG